MRAITPRLLRAGFDLRARRLRRLAGELPFVAGLSAAGAGRSSAETRSSGPGSLSNTGSRRAVAGPRFDAITRPDPRRRARGLPAPKSRYACRFKGPLSHRWGGVILINMQRVSICYAFSPSYRQVQP